MMIEASTIALTLAASCEYLRTRRGPLMLLALAVMHARAILLCLRREIRRGPARWRVEYGLALRDVKEGM